jgi:hypothetical protein
MGHGLTGVSDEKGRTCRSGLAHPAGAPRTDGVLMVIEEKTEGKTELETSRMSRLSGRALAYRTVNSTVPISRPRLLHRTRYEPGNQWPVVLYPTLGRQVTALAVGFALTAPSRCPE